MASAPYPAETRAKGWRLEIDHERVRQSDTWALAAPEVRPWLLMMWMVAWEQTPCGALPNDDALIVARLGMPQKLFAKHRAILMRCWWLADDGRLYHDVLVQRVTEMLDSRKKNAKRVADFKQKMREQRAGNALPPEQQQGENDTGTGTSTGTSKEAFPPSQAGEGDETDLTGFTPTPAGMVCKALRVAGVAAVNPSNPTLLALLDAGASTEEFVAAAAKASDKSKPFEYLLTVVQNERQKAKTMAGTLHTGPLPAKAPTTAELRVLQAAPGIAAPHLRAQPAHILAEVIDVAPKLLG